MAAPLPLCVDASKSGPTCLPVARNHVTPSGSGPSGVCRGQQAREGVPGTQGTLRPSLETGWRLRGSWLLEVGLH